MVSGIGSNIASISVQPLGAAAKPKPAAEGFEDVFKYAIANVDSLQNSADHQIAQVLHGKGNVDMGQVAVAVEKSDVAFQLMMQVRNKIVTAYQDIEKMQF